MATQTLHGGTFTSSAGEPVSATLAWNTPTNAAASDNVYTTITDVSLDDISEYLKVTNFGFTVSGTVTGITVVVERKCNTASACWDYSVRLIKGGTVTGDDKATNTTFPTSDGTQSYGGAGITWSISPTASDINASNFGVAFAAQDASVGSGWQAFVDDVTITVEYTPVASSNTLPLLGVGS